MRDNITSVECARAAGYGFDAVWIYLWVLASMYISLNDMQAVWHGVVLLGGMGCESALAPHVVKYGLRPKYQVGMLEVVMR